MSKTSLFIKNMVCDRCIMSVKSILDKHEIPWTKVVLGRADVDMDSSLIDAETLDKDLKAIGFELIRDKNEILVEKVKNLVVEYIHHHEGEALKINFSDYLTDNIGSNYTFISSAFSKSEGITIEKYIIRQKIEKVKELISYNQLNFSEIAFKVNYSSSAHLSKQFKEITGLTLSQYRQVKESDRKSLDNVV